MFRLLLILALTFAAGAVAARAATSGDYFGVRVVDADTGRGVPLARLRTTYGTAYYTDSAGYVAFLEPGLMGRDVWFDVASYGYESPKGPFGTIGVRLKTTPGATAEVRLERTQIAERLYRTTGYGVYRDARLLGRAVPLDRPPLPGLVTGSDTVQTAVYRGKMRWFWQDTNRLDFALGNFAMTGATGALPDRVDPDVGVRFDYFTREVGGFAREMSDIKQPDPKRPIWIDGLMVVPDRNGNERLLARWAAAEPDLSVRRMGLCLYDDARDCFVDFKVIPTPAATRLYPSGHPFRAKVGGRTYYYFSDPLPNVRVPADFENAGDLSAYEGLTCYAPGRRGDVARDAGGRVVWSWRRGVEPVTAEEFARLVADGKVTADDSPFALRDVGTGKPLGLAAGSVAWNPHLGKWTFLFGQLGGESNLGEIWFAVAAAPEGPWRDARKVATHAMPGGNMDLYNPMQHPELSRCGGRFVYFEGTLAKTFSGTSTPVPYYDYNNLMYRLDAADPRLALPEPPPALNGLDAAVAVSP